MARAGFSFTRGWPFLVWALLIYVTVPLAIAVRRTIADSWGRAAFGYIVVVLIVLGTAGAVVALKRLRQRGARGHMGWLLLVGAVYIGLTYHMRAIPEEALHFVQYGILALLAFRGVQRGLRGGWAFVGALLLCAMAGTVDEVVQWFVPQRIFDFRDIRTNVLGAALALVGLGLGWRPATSELVSSRASMAWCARWFAFLLLLLGLCLSNTPKRVDAYAARIPGLSFLVGNPSIMNEFGYRHAVDGRYVFKSRFTLDELTELDRARGAEVGALLDAYGTREGYSRFLDRYTPSTDPFAHEARVHLFSRNKHLSDVGEARAAGDARRVTGHCTAAYWEDRILETHFGHSLSNSAHVLRQSRVDFMLEHYDPDHVHESAVSRSLVTRVSEGRLWAGIGVAVVLLLGLDPASRAWKKRRKKFQ